MESLYSQSYPGLLVSKESSNPLPHSHQRTRRELETNTILTSWQRAHMISLASDITDMIISFRGYLGSIITLTRFNPGDDQMCRNKYLIGTMDLFDESFEFDQHVLLDNNQMNIDFFGSCQLFKRPRHNQVVLFNSEYTYKGNRNVLVLMDLRARKVIQTVVFPEHVDVVPTQMQGIL